MNKQAILPKVTVITTSYNHGLFIEQTILSVLDQGYPNLEYIIIDGGSTDNTREIIKKYESKLAYCVSEKDNGQSHAFNKGLAKATGEFIGWLNSDDLYYPNSIQYAIEKFIQDPSIDIVFGNYDCIDSKDNLIHSRKEICFDYNIYLWTNACYHANLAGFFKRSCFETYGGLKESLIYVMDFEMYLRFGWNNCKFVQVDRVLGAYRFHSASKTVTLVSNELMKKNEFDNVFNEYLAKASYSGLQKIINPYFYRFLRYYKKLLNGSYSVGSLMTRKALNEHSRGYN